MSTVAQILETYGKGTAEENKPEGRKKFEVSWSQVEPSLVTTTARGREYEVAIFKSNHRDPSYRFSFVNKRGMPTSVAPFIRRDEEGWELDSAELEVIQGLFRRAIEEIQSLVERDFQEAQRRKDRDKRFVTPGFSGPRRTGKTERERAKKGKK